MKGVILAGGTGSRLRPLTRVTNKHLLPIGQYPMIFHPVSKLADAGIDEIMIVTGVEHMGDVVRTLGSGRSLGMEFTYRVQDAAGGIAQALSLAKEFVGRDLCTVILGDNIFEDTISPFVERYKDQGGGAKILLKEVDDPTRFGVPEISGEDVVGIEEKPEKPKSHYCVTGIYMYDAWAFQAIQDLSPSERGEFEITDVNNSYIAKSRLTYDILPGWWTDAGTMASYANANRLSESTVLRLFDEKQSQ